MHRKILSIILTVLMLATMIPSFSVSAAPVTPVITLQQSAFTNPETSAAMRVVAGSPYPGPGGGLASLQVKANASAGGAAITEGWDYHTRGILVNTYKYVRITYYYDTNPTGEPENRGTENAVGQKMKFLIGFISNSSGSEKNPAFFTTYYSSNEEIVANQEATCTIDFSAFSTEHADLLATYDRLKQVKWKFFGLDNVNTLNVNDKMYIKRVDFFPVDPANPTDSVTLTFTAGTGTGTSFSQTVGVYSTFTFPEKPTDFANGGRNFSGWKYNDNIYTAGESIIINDDEDATITAVWADTVAYVSTDGEIPGYEGEVFTSIPSAVTFLGPNGGTIYIEGEYYYTSAISLPSTARDTITIKGYNDTAEGNILWTNKKGAHFTVDGGDLVIDNITIKNQAADETSWVTNGKTLTFGPGVVYDGTNDKFLNEANTLTSGSNQLWLAAVGNVTRPANKIIVQSDSLKTSVVAPIQGWGTAATVTGHTLYDLRGGTHGSLFGTTRDGRKDNSNGGKIYGDVTYLLSGGSYTHISTGGNSGKAALYGNILIHITGGSYSGTDIGFNSGNTAGRIGHQAYVVDLKEYKENSTDTDGFTISNGNRVIDSGKRIVILNNVEENPASGNKVNVTATPEYYILVTGGKAMPAFAPSSTVTTSTTHGALNGFYLAPDVPTNTKVIVNGSPLPANAYNSSTGAYDLSAYESTTTPIRISFADENAVFTTVSFASGLAGATGSIADVQAIVGQPFALPANPYTKQGYLFRGWEYDGEIYPEGASFPSVPTTPITFTAIWADLSAANTIYLDAENGDDANTGDTEANAVKTWAKAYDITKLAGTNDGGTIKILSNIDLPNGFLGVSTTNMVTIEGKTGTEILSIKGQTHLVGPTTFKNITFFTKQYCHINTFDKKVVFDTGISKATADPAGTDAPFAIGLHAGVNGDPITNYNSTGIDLTINSGEFQGLMVGGAYLKSTNNQVNGDVKITVNGGTIGGIQLTTDSYNNSGTTSTHQSVVFNRNVFLTFNGGSIGGVSINEGNIITGVPKVQKVQGNYQVIVNSGATVGTVAVPKDGLVIGDVYIINSGEGGKVSHYIDVPGLFEIEVDETPLIINEVEAEVSEDNLYILTPGVNSVLYGATRYQLSYDANGATSGTVPAAQNVYADSVITLPAVGDLVKTGHTLLGWETPDGKVYAPGQTFIMPAENTVITAKWFDTTTDLEIYADSVNGDDANTGYSFASAKKTLTAAYTALTQKGTIYLAGEFTPGTLPTKAFKVTLTSNDLANKAKLLIAANGGAFYPSNVEIVDVVFNAGLNSHNNITDIAIFKNVAGLPIMHLGPSGSTVLNKDISLTYENITTSSPIHVGGAYITEPSGNRGGVNGNVTLIIKNSTTSYIGFGADSWGAASNGYTGGKITGNVRILAEGSGTVISSIYVRNASYKTTNDSKITIDGAAEVVLSDGATVTGNLEMPGTLAAGGNWVVRGDTGVIIEPTAVIGTYDISTATDALAIVNEATGEISYQPKGSVTLPEGVYSIYGLFGTLDGSGDVLVDFSINQPKALLVQDKIFIGYYNETQSKYIESGDTIAAGDTVKAKYLDLVTDPDSPDANFYIVGAQIRTSGVQGIRFINQMSKSDLRDILAAFDPEFIPDDTTDTSVGYGMVVFPTALIPAGKQIEKDSSFDGKDVAIVPAVNIFETNTTDDYIRYTAVLIGITPDKYQTNYTVRPYITYKDAHGSEYTVYGQAYSTNLKAVALAAINGTQETEETKKELIDQFFDGVDPRTAG